MITRKPARRTDAGDTWTSNSARDRAEGGNTWG